MMNHSRANAGRCSTVASTRHTLHPHPEESAAGGRLEGWAPGLVVRADARAPRQEEDFETTQGRLLAMRDQHPDSCASAFSRRECARVLRELFRPGKKGAGNAGRPMRPQPRVRNKKAHELVTTGSPKSPAFPARWFYGLLRALPGDRACLPPSPADRSASLTPASGRQNHTTSPSAIMPFVCTASSRPPHPAI